jgi:phenylacetate-CoA ligase
MSAIDAATRERHPLIGESGLRMLRRLREHPDAPRFNYATGDRLRAEDLPQLAAYRERIASERGPSAAAPSAQIVARAATWRETVPLYRRILPAGADLAREWQSLPTTSRADFARAPWEFVPDDQPLDRLVIYRTAGTTGHPISVPHHPIAIRCYEPLIEEALARHGVHPRFAADRVAAFLIGAQIRTYTYTAILHAWGGAGFAKLNIRPADWPREDSARRYVAEFSPALLTGDPISFAQMLRQDIDARPLALITTSVALSPGLREKLRARYRAPVIDWYSLVETGPIGYLCPRDANAYHLLPPDIHVEALRPDGSAAAAGERGEIAVTGGRNPFAPLLRYRTGDYGRIERGPCACGDPTPRLVELEGRSATLFRSGDGTPVSTVDLSRLLREHPLLLHEFVQHGDGRCELVIRPLPDARPDPARIEADLRGALGDVPLAIRVDPELGDRREGKVLAYRSELMLED